MNTDKEVNKVMMNPAANSSPTILDSNIAPWVIAALAMNIMATTRFANAVKYVQKHHPEHMHAPTQSAMIGGGGGGDAFRYRRRVSQLRRLKL
jgi:hypothetical protein